MGLLIFLLLCIAMLVQIRRRHNLGSSRAEFLSGESNRERKAKELMNQRN